MDIPKPKVRIDLWYKSSKGTQLFRFLYDDRLVIEVLTYLPNVNNIIIGRTGSVKKH